jgi:hypothetical protein
LGEKHALGRNRGAMEYSAVITGWCDLGRPLGCMRFQRSSLLPGGFSIFSRHLAILVLVSVSPLLSSSSIFCLIHLLRLVL